MNHLWLLAALLLLIPMPANSAFGPVALIMIVFSPDGSRYGDKVLMTPDEKSCEMARAEMMKSAVQAYGKDHWVFSICTKPKALGAVEV